MSPILDPAVEHVDIWTVECEIPAHSVAKSQTNIGFANAIIDPSIMNSNKISEKIQWYLYRILLSSRMAAQSRQREV